MWRFLSVLALLAAILFVLALAGSSLLGEATGAADLRRAEIAAQERVSIAQAQALAQAQAEAAASRAHADTAQAVIWAPILPLLAALMFTALLAAAGMAMGFVLLSDRHRSDRRPQ